jgi:hypothetical protein
MSPVSEKYAKSARPDTARMAHAAGEAASAAAAGIERQTDLLFHNEFLWAPARATANIMLRAQRNAMAMMQINRKLADELRDIMRHEQDVICGVSQKMFTRMTSGTTNSEDSDSGEPLNKLYESAVESVREFNEAMAEAQSRSFAALREHAQATADVSSNTAKEAADVTRQTVEQEAA